MREHGQKESHGWTKVTDGRDGSEVVRGSYHLWSSKGTYSLYRETFDVFFLLQGPLMISIFVL